MAGGLRELAWHFVTRRRCVVIEAPQSLGQMLDAIVAEAMLRPRVFSAS